MRMTKWGEKNGIEYWTMTLDKAEEGLSVLNSGFFPEESFCSSVGIDKDVKGQRELGNLSVVSAADGASIIAVDKESKRIAGVCYNKVQTAPPPGQKSFFEEFRDSKCKTKSAKALISEMMWFDCLVDLYEKYNAKCSLEIMFLATHPDFRKRGVAVALVEHSLALGASLTSPKPDIATAIFTSPYSIRIGRTLQFEEIICVPMSDKFYEGKCFTENPHIGKDHPGSIVMVKKIKN